MEVLSSGKPNLTSGRNQIALLRTQLGRITTCLHALEIEAVMTACVAMEKVETHMTVGGRKGEGALLCVPANVEAKAMLSAAIREACSMLVAAEELLQPAAK